MELLASGRTAEVYAWDDGRVVKLDRPQWNGLCAIEAAALGLVVAAGVPVPRPFELVTVGARQGIVLERIDGPILRSVIAGATDAEVESLAVRWTELHAAINALPGAGLPDLVVGLRGSVRNCGLTPDLVAELLELVDTLDDGRRNLCHFDLHPGNVIIGPGRWVVIDWTTASAGPPDADLARSLVLDPPDQRSARGRFVSAAMRLGITARGTELERVAQWVRVVAGARLAEGFDGEQAHALTALASGARRIDKEVVW